MAARTKLFAPEPIPMICNKFVQGLSRALLMRPNGYDQPYLLTGRACPPRCALQVFWMLRRC